MTEHDALRLKLALVSMLANYSMETSLIFMPLHAAGIGASDLVVGLVGTAYGLSYFLSSLFFGKLSDLRGRTPLVRAGLLLLAASYLSQVFAPSPAWLILTRLAVGFSMGVTSGPLMAYVYERDGAVGRFASVGSLGWLLGALTAVLVPRPEALFVASACASGAALFVALLLDEGPGSPARAAGEVEALGPPDHRPGSPARAAGEVEALGLPGARTAPATGAVAGAHDVSTGRVLRANLPVYLAFLLRHAGATAIWSIFPLYLAQLGASRQWIAAMDCINVGGQAIAMRFVDRFDPARMLLLGLHLSTAIFGVYAVATHYLQLVPVQIVLSVAWSCLLVGAMSLLMRRSRDRGTASGLLYSTNSLATAAGPLLGGAVSQATGSYAAVMVAASALSAAGWAVARRIKKWK
jgi:MFS family permease